MDEPTISEGAKAYLALVRQELHWEAANAEIGRSERFGSPGAAYDELARLAYLRGREDALGGAPTIEELATRIRSDAAVRTEESGPNAASQALTEAVDGFVEKIQRTMKEPA